MSDKEEGLPGYRETEAARRDENGEKEVASPADRASERREAEDAAEAENTSMPEAEAGGDSISQSESALKPSPEYSTKGNDSSSGGNGRSRGKSAVWFVILVLLIILAAAGNAYYTRFLIGKAQEARQALAEELTEQFHTRVKSLVTSRIDKRLSKLSESRASLRQAIAGLERAVEKHAARIAGLERTVEERAHSMARLERAVDKRPPARSIASLKRAVEEYAARIASLERTVKKHTRSIASLEKAVDPHIEKTVIARLKKAVNQYAGSIKAIRQDIEALQSALRSLSIEVEKGPQPGDWSIAEAAYLMRIAGERLQLARDVNTAIVALQRADDIFQRMGNPVFEPVRSKIAEAIQALKSVPVPDINDMASTLTHWIKQVSELKLKHPAPEETATAAKDQKKAGQTATPKEDSFTAKAQEFLHVIWSDLKELATVSQSGEKAKGVPVLAPEKRYFLYQNLRLELQGARLSLLRRNQASFQQSLQLAQKWLQTYFQGSTAKAMRESLAELAQTPISPELPDISGVLKTLRRVVRHRGAQAAGDDQGDNP